MKANTIKKGDVLYMLDRNSYNPNDIDRLIIKVDIIEEDGVLHAYGKDGPFTIKFEITSKIDNMSKPGLFRTHAEAKAQYDSELKQSVQRIHDMSQQEVLALLFEHYTGEHTEDVHIYRAMEEKIKKEFNVDVRDA